VSGAETPIGCLGPKPKFSIIYAVIFDVYEHDLITSAFQELKYYALEKNL